MPTLLMLLPLFPWFLHYACARKAAGAAWQEGGTLRRLRDSQR